MDLLSETLSWVRVEGTLSRRSEFSAPWAIAYAPAAHVSFMVVEEGSALMAIDGGEDLALEAGDLVMITPGVRASLMDARGRRAVPYAHVLAANPPHDRTRRGSLPTLRHGGGGRVTAFRAWGLRFEGYERHPLIDLLPAVVHISYGRRGALPWLETTLRFLLHETYEPSDGSEMVSNRLVDLLFVQVIRAWFAEQPEGEAGWMGAIRDRQIGQALERMHQDPAAPWTVDSLARAASMSRSSFSARFRALVGRPPLGYLTRLRMNLAAVALDRDASLGIATIAAEVGYDSESSFCRAFRRAFDTSPGAFRRRPR